MSETVKDVTKYTGWIPGQYVWVEGKLTDNQPNEFPEKLRVYIHGVGTGVAKSVKPIQEAAVPEAITAGSLADKPQVKDFKRCEGLYLKWSLPMAEPNTPLVIERVNGDCSVSEFIIARDEARHLITQLQNFLRGQA